MSIFSTTPVDVHSDLQIINVFFYDITLLLQDVAVNISDSEFHNVMLRSNEPCQNLRVILTNTTLGGKAVTSPLSGHSGRHVANDGDHAIVCNQSTVVINNVKLLDSKLHMKAQTWAEIDITNSTFTKILRSETGMGGVNVTLPLLHGHLRVTQCVFSNLVHWEPILSAINIEAGALRIEALRKVRRENELEIKQNNTVLIQNTTFMHNERALSISRSFSLIQITGCVFSHNKVMHAAAALRLALDANDGALITDSHFLHNAAGATDHTTIKGHFEVDREQVTVNDDQYKGVISLVGKGGALRIHRGGVRLVRCTFIDNTARLLGGAIFVDRWANVSIVDSYFEGSHSHVHSIQGDILYSNGAAHIKKSRFFVKTADNHVTILRHSGSYWSMDVESLWFQCPVGHLVLMVNTTSHRIKNEVGLLRSHKLDQLSYYCQTCGNNRYSLDYGYINYTLMNNATEYFTLLINGQEPFQSHSVDFIYGNISCHDCPYGARCDNDISSVANFWGYEDQRLAVFQHCPQDYCCSSHTCPSITSCADNREGRLCGKCRPGHSEALFSFRCVSNEICGNLWLWPLIIAMGIVYSLFLVFQKDIRDYMFAWDIDWNRFECCRSKPGLVEMIQKNRRNTCDIEMKYKITSNGKDSRKSSDTLNLTYQQDDDEDHITKDDEYRKEAGFLIIMFYYFQDALLLHIGTVYTKTVSKFEIQLKSFLLAFFRFRLDFYQFMDDVCLFPNLQPVPKMFLKTLFVPYVLILFGLFYGCYSWWLSFNRRRTTSTRSTRKRERSLSTKFAGGFILTLLFTYQKLATATFTLLNCVPVANKSVLFIDGTEECFQPWQYGVMAYAFSCVVLFSAILMVGPPLLKHAYISLTEFFFGCLCPFPALIYWAIVSRGSMKRHSATTGNINLSHETRTVLEILEGPFKEPDSRFIIGQVCWSGVLIGRRLILFLCFTFINSVLVRLLCMLAVCFIILLHHVYVQPYSSYWGNLAGALSAAALLVVGGINLMRAGFEAAEYIPQGPNKFLMEVFEEIENTLVLWLPLAGMCLIMLVLVARISLSVILKFHIWFYSDKSNRNLESV